MATANTLPTASSSASTSTSPPPRRRIRVAVIGSGLTGLSAAYYLKTWAKSLRGGDDDDASVEVHIFEKARKIGLDSSSISVTQRAKGPDKCGAVETVRVDVPMRSINAGYYPRVMALYRHLQIPLHKSNFTYSFAECPSGTGSGSPSASIRNPVADASPRCPSPWLLYEGSSGVRGFSLPSKLRFWSPPSTTSRLGGPTRASQSSTIGIGATAYAACEFTLQLLSYVIGYLILLSLSLYHHYLGHTRDPRHPLASQTLRSYFLPSSTSPRGWRVLAAPRRVIMERFLTRLVVPLFSAMMTVQSASVLEAPIAELMDYVALTFGRSHYTVATGVHEVEERIAKPLSEEHVHVDCTVQGLRLCRRDAQADGVVPPYTVTIQVLEKGQTREYPAFDHIILATQASQSARFVRGYHSSLQEEFCDSKAGHSHNGTAAAELERVRQMSEQLQCFTYEDSKVVNHVDRSLLPADEADWRDLNLVTPARGSLTSGKYAHVVGQADSPLSSGPSTPSSSSSREAVLVPGEGLGTPESAAYKHCPMPAQRMHSRRTASSLGSNTHTMASHIICRSFKVANNDDGDKSTTTITTLIQTTNPLFSDGTSSHSPGLGPRPETVLSVSYFERAVLDLASKHGQKGLFEWHWRRRREADHPSRRLRWLKSIIVSRVLPPALIPRDRWVLQLGGLQGRVKPRRGGCSVPDVPPPPSPSPSPFPGIWACGSWSPGIPLLEGCVTSSQLVVKSLLESEFGA